MNYLMLLIRIIPIEINLWVCNFKDQRKFLEISSWSKSSKHEFKKLWNE